MTSLPNGGAVLGPGRYGARAEALLRADGATVVLIISIGGPAGAAFDVAAVHPAALTEIPTILRRVAEDIERGQG